MNKTRQRDLILHAVLDCCGHPTADEIFRAVREELPNISLGTVYRNLGMLTDIGEIRKISVPGQPDHFDRNAVWHDHMVCVKCGKMLDVTLTGAPTLMEQLAQRSGLPIYGYSLVAQCLCPECTARDAAGEGVAG